jgi:nucleotide-binding universal stress UspA family protein
MKNIVVGIDFSKNSYNAMKHAIAISLRNKAKLHLAWVKTAALKTDFATTTAAKDFQAAIKEKLAQWEQECKAEAPESSVTSVVLEGKPAVELCNYAAYLPKSMIVMGTHGVSGFEEFFVGNNAFKTINMTKVPVLILREDIQINRDLTEILVPIDTSFETLQKMKTAIEFAKDFNAKICLLGVINPVNNDIKHVINVQLNHGASMCKKANVRYDVQTLEVPGDSIPALLDAAKKMDVNLMVIMREEEHDLSSVWMGSNTRQIVNNSPMPLVIVPNVNQFLLNK